jgi:hypothetical protein
MTERYRVLMVCLEHYTCRACLPTIHEGSGYCSRLPESIFSVRHANNLTGSLYKDNFANDKSCILALLFHYLVLKFLQILKMYYDPSCDLFMPSMSIRPRISCILSINLTSLLQNMFLCFRFP